MSQICSFCGCPLEEGSGVCPNCGSPVSGGDSFEEALYTDPSLESFSGEDYSSEAAVVPEPAPEAPVVSVPEVKTPPKPVSVPKASDYDHIVPSYTTSAPKTPPASTTYTPPAAKPKKKRGCCGCGCCLPVLIAILLCGFLIVSGIAGEIFSELGIPVDLSEIEMLLDELMGKLPFDSSSGQTETVPHPEGDIPETAVEFDGHYYHLYTAPVDSYEAAQAFCQERGGYLASVTSYEENQFLYGYILDQGLTEYAWLGGSDADEEGLWRWSSGEPFDYTNWSDGEPNDDLDGEDHMAMHCLLEGGMWNDIAFATPSVIPIYPESAHVEVSTVLKNKEKYSAAVLTDGDPAPAWNEGADGITGETVTHFFGAPTLISGLEIRGGFQASSEDYYSSARPKVITLSFSDGSVFEYALEDVMDVQYITLDEPVVADTVVLTVVDSYPGSYYDDLCISELYYHVGTLPVNGFICEWGEPANIE